MKFSATKEYSSRLYELQPLLMEARKNNRLDTLYVKSSISLLGTYLEVYLEELIEEFITKINQQNVKYHKLPQELQKSHIKYLLEKYKQIHSFDPGKDNINHLTHIHSSAFIELLVGWDSEKINLDILAQTSSYRHKNGKEINIQLNPINKFNYGKHGETEVKRLFKNVGLIFDEAATKAWFNSMNEFISIRNSVTHSVGSISTSVRDVRIYCVKFNQACKLLDGLLYDHYLAIVS